MSSSLGHGSRRRQGAGRRKRFSFTTGDLVLVKWEDGMVYFAKIKRIDQKKEKCTVVFDDKSQDEADFSQIHSVDETTTDIICIKCKKDDSDSPNEIVLCDKCGIGFHQKCHNPVIPVSALQLDIPWNCSYCQREVKCPFLTESLDVLQNLLSDDNETTTGDEQDGGVESEYEVGKADSSSRSTRKRKVKKSHDRMQERRKSFRLHTITELSSLVTTERKTTVASYGSSETNDTTASQIKAQSPSEISVGDLETTRVPENLPIRKRKKHHASSSFQKRLKRPSVESHTVSVTRIDTPIYEDKIFSPRGSCDDAASSKELSPEPAAVHAHSPKDRDDFRLVLSPSTTPTKVKKRAFRVSLSLPEDVEKRRPSVETDKKALMSLTPSSWDEIVSSVSPKSRSPSTEKDSNSESSIPDLVRAKEEKHVPFLASPLPITSSKKRDLTEVMVKTENKSASGVGTETAKSGIENETITTEVENTVEVSSSGIKDESTTKKLNKKRLQSEPKTVTKELTEPVERSVKVCSSGGEAGKPLQFKPVKTVERTIPAEHSLTSPLQSVKTDVSEPTPSAAKDIRGIATMSVGYSSVPKIDVTGKASTNSVVVGSIKTSDSILSLSDDSPVPEMITDASKPPEHIQTTLESPNSCANPVAVESPLEDSPAVKGAGSEAEILAAIQTITQENIPECQDPNPAAAVTPDPATSIITRDTVTKPHQSSEDDTPSLMNHSPAKVGEHLSNLPKIIKTDSSSNPALTPCQPKKPRPSVLEVETESPVVKSSASEGLDFDGVTAAAPTPVITTTGPVQVRPQQRLGMHHNQMGKSDKALITSTREPSKQLSAPAAAAAAVIAAAAASATAVPQRKGQRVAVNGESPQSKSVRDAVNSKESKMQKECDVATTGKSLGSDHSGTKDVGTEDVDPDVIITGIEPSLGDAKPKEMLVQLKSSQPVGIKGPSSGTAASTPLYPTATSPLHAGSSGSRVLYYQIQTSGPPRTFSEKPLHSKPQAFHQIPKAGSVYTSTTPAAHSPGPAVAPNSSPQSVICQAQGPPGTHMYYSIPPESGTPPSNVAVTTKPYAIVSALPTQQDVGYMVPSKPGMVPEGMGVVRLISEGTVQQQQQPGHVLSTGGGASTSLPPPPSYTTFMTENKKKTLVTEEELQSIHKKIGDAFTQSSEVMLVSAFEEAWKKFQDNDNVYKGKAAEHFVAEGTLSSPQTDPSKGPGTSGQQNLVHKMSTTKARAAPTQNTRGLPGFVGPKYIHHHAATSGGGAQQQMIIQSVPPDYGTIYAIPAAAAAAAHAQGKQVHVTGLYYPAVAENPSQSDLNVAAKHVSVSQHHREALPQSQVAKPHTATTTTQHVPRTKGKKCARCGENATYLCSGCHLEWYCGRDCQLKSWEVHSNNCKA